MAHFKYLGQPVNPSSHFAPADCTEVIIPKANGTKYVLKPVSPATKFTVGADMGYDITDAKSLSIMRAATTRFQEV